MVNNVGTNAEGALGGGTRGASNAVDRRTSVDKIFDHLYDQVVSMRPRPDDD